jgi:HAD superfamily hydrolase (TIGR01509 family)
MSANSGGHERKYRLDDAHASAPAPRLRLLFAERFHESDNSPSGEEPDDPMAAAGRFNSIDGLVFDMGDVLFDATAWRRRLLQLLRHMGLQAGYRSLFDLWDSDYLDAVHRGDRDYAEAFVAFLRDAGLSPAQIDEAVTASHQFKRQIEAEVRPFPGVRETLDRLRDQGLRLAVLSDSESPSAAIAERLRTLGIGDAFSVVVSSVDLRQTKPNPLGYRTAVERLGLRPDRVAFVGHDAAELRGARRCGMRTIAFNYDREATADCRISRFCDLQCLFSHRRGNDATQSKAA